MELLTHSNLKQQEVIERYVRDQLSPEERRAFQEHYFTCDACFAQVEATGRLISGIRDAAASGLLNSTVEAPALSGRGWRRWLQPSLAVALSPLLILAATAGWFLLYREPKLREQITREQQLREQAARDNQQHLTQIEGQLRQEREARAKAESQLSNQERETNARDQVAANEIPRNLRPREALNVRADSNIPIVILQAIRDAGTTNSLEISRTALTFMLWIETSSAARFDSYRLQIYTSQNKPVETVRGLKTNSYGALTVSLPSKAFQSDSYLVRLYGEAGAQTTLAAEYRLQIHKQ